MKSTSRARLLVSFLLLSQSFNTSLVHADLPHKIYRNYAAALIPNGDPTWTAYANSGRTRRYDVNGIVTVGIDVRSYYGDRIDSPDGYRFRVQIDGADVSPDIIGPGTFQLDTTSIPDGTHWIGVRVLHHPSTDLSYIRPMPSLIFIDNVAGPTLGAQSVAAPAMDILATADGQNTLEQSTIPPMIPFTGQQEHPATLRPYSYTFVPPAHTLADINVLENIDNWFKEGLNETFYEWGAYFKAEFMQTKAGHILVKGENPRIDVVSEGAKPVDERKVYRDGPRNDNTVSPYSSFTPIPGGPGWAGVDVSGRLFKLDQFGTVTTIAGQAIPAGSNVIPYLNTDPAFTTAQIIAHQKVLFGNFAGNLLFNLPNDLTYDPLNSNVIYVADTDNQRIAKVDLSGATASVTTYAGQPGVKGNQDGPRLSATFNRPYSITATSSGDLYVADRDNLKIRKIAVNGTVSTFATLPPGNKPQVVRHNSLGELFAGIPETKSIYKISIGGGVSLLTDQMPWDTSSWSWMDIDWRGNIGARDVIYAVNSRGGANGRSSIQRVDPQTGTQEEWLPSPGGNFTHGRLSRQHIDRFGHYTWAMAIDDEECRFVTTGFGTHGVVSARMAVPTDPPMHPFDSVYRGQDILVRGSVPQFYLNARPNLSYVWGMRGHSRLGNMPFFDDIVGQTDAQLAAYIQAGMGSGVPRPEITGNDLRDLIFFIRLSSLQGETTDIRPGPDDPDTVKPIINGVNSVRLSATSIQINWNTNEQTISRILYGPRPELGLGSSIEGGYSAAHSMTLADLENQNYYFEIISKDRAGNVARYSGTTGPVPPLFGVHPADVTTMQNGSAAFNADATGTPSPTFQWEKRPSGSQTWSPISGQTGTTLNLTNIPIGDSGSKYRLIAANANGTASSREALLTVLPPNAPPFILQHPSSLTVSVGSPASFTVVAIGGLPLSYQWLNGGLPIPGETAATFAIPSTTMANNNMWIQCVVTNPFGTLSSNAATLQVTGGPVAPIITQHPVSVTINVGNTATFTVAANGTAPLNYQWQRRPNATGTWADMTGATAASYTTPAAVNGDNGSQFRCIVSNTAGSATSNAATLSINGAPSAPSIHQNPLNVTVNAGNSATFTIGASGTAPLGYQWEKSSNGGGSWASVNGATSASYTTPPTTITDNGSRFRCVVTNAIGSATSSGAILSVRLTFGAMGSQPMAFSKDENSLWVANPDSDSISIFTLSPSLTKTGEFSVPGKPRTIALSLNGNELFATCETDNTLAVIDKDTGGVTRRVPVGMAPYGVAVAPISGRVVVTNQNDGTVSLFDSNLNPLAVINVGDHPRAVVISADGSKAFVSHYISRGLSGKLTQLNLNTAAVDKTVSLIMDPGPDLLTAGQGVPNLLSSLAIDPSGNAVWAGGVKSNILRGVFRNAVPFNPENRVRGFAALVGVNTGVETLAHRIDTDDADSVTAIGFSPDAKYAYLLHQGSGQLTTYDVVKATTFDKTNGDQVPFESRIDVGDAPQGILVTADGSRAYVTNFISRDVSVINLSNPAVPSLMQNVPSTIEPLATAIALGKKMFYRSKDPVHSKKNYLACVSCHADGGGHDGQTWDLTQFGEGLRNTIDLRGKGGMDHGPLHWSGNFDEIQDFENDIVTAFGGSGLAHDGQGPHPPLGVVKNRGRSQELDALAAYVSSLKTPAKSPFRNHDGSLTPSAKRGKILFMDPALKCASCHAPPRFTDSVLTANSQDFVFHDVGTLTAGSGKRLNGSLTGLDTPSLLGAWASAPYLHDGSAATLRDVLTTRNPQDKHGSTSQLSTNELADLEAYLKSIDDSVMDDTALVDAGADRAVFINTPLQMNGRVIIDGSPAPASVAVRWTKTAGSGAVTMSDPADLNATLVFENKGQYAIELSAIINGIAVKDSVTILAQDGVAGQQTERITPVITPRQGPTGQVYCPGDRTDVWVNNMKGVRVRLLQKEPGDIVSWDGLNEEREAVASGIYFVNCRGGAKRFVIKK